MNPDLMLASTGVRRVINGIALWSLRRSSVSLTEILKPAEMVSDLREDQFRTSLAAASRRLSQADDGTEYWATPLEVSTGSLAVPKTVCSSLWQIFTKSPTPLDLRSYGLVISSWIAAPILESSHNKLLWLGLSM